MIFSYLFEVKSIQAYLFRSGKLKDVIAASERLGNLIDTSDSCTLYQVLQNANIQSDLLKPDEESSAERIQFLRCKGGSFYAYCQQKEPLVKLRSLWTLTVQQLFPSLEFVDALTEADKLSEAINLGHRELAADRNAPLIKFPLATAIADRYARTGAVAVPISKLAKHASMNEKSDESKENILDLDTELHRQAYQSLDMRGSAALQDRFTPDALKGQFSYPINLDKDFQYSAPDVSANNKDAIKDIALIHIDGNGLGILLMGLKEVLQNRSDEEYRQGFRNFSDSLSKATEEAAKIATKWLYEVSAYQHKAEGDNEKRTYLPMRPIVLGGDDVTLLCRADLALEYSKRFCKAFKETSQKHLKSLYEKHLKDSSLKPYLTASGGILFHKASHPFTHSHHLVEDLCQLAKRLTKSVVRSAQEVGPAALAFHRLSNAVSDSFDAIKQRSQQFIVQDNQKSFPLDLGQNAFFVDTEETAIADIKSLERLVELCRTKTAPVSMAKWRQIATHLSLGNKTEADRIYNRSIERCKDNNELKVFNSLFKQIAGQNAGDNQWYWRLDGSDNYQTIISDMLIVDHFRPVIQQIEPSPRVDTTTEAN